MKPLTRFLALLLATGVLLAADATSAAERPTLRPAITVESGLVTLGDLFANAGELADVAVFRAPDPGESGAVSSRRVEDAARRHGLAWRDDGMMATVSVTRTSTRVGLDLIRNAIAEAARDKLALGAEARLEVTLDRDSRPLHLPPQASDAIQVTHLDIGDANGAFRAEIRATDENAGAVRAVYRGRAVETAQVAVLAASLARGNVIGPNDIVIRELPRGKLPPDAAIGEEEIVGMQAKRSLLAAVPIRRGDIEPPHLVTRNGAVIIFYRTGQLLLSVQGRSLDDGAAGDLVQVLNPRSKRIIEGVVTGRDRVDVSSNVPLTPARTALNLPRDGARR